LRASLRASECRSSGVPCKLLRNIGSATSFVCECHKEQSVDIDRQRRSSDDAGAIMKRGSLTESRWGIAVHGTCRVITYVSFCIVVVDTKWLRDILDDEMPYWFIAEINYVAWNRWRWMSPNELRCMLHKLMTG